LPLRENITSKISQLIQNNDNKDNIPNNKPEIINIENRVDNFDQDENSFKQHSNSNNFLSFNIQY
jgi:hypothetical protein